MPYFRSTYGQNYFEAYGRGTPIVFIAGLGASHQVWFRQVEELGQHFLILTPDNTGAGYSSPPREDLTIQTMAQDIFLLLDHVGLEGALVIGSSMGSLMAQSFTAKYSEKTLGLILISPMLQADENLCSRLEPLLKEKIPPKKYLKKFLPLLFTLPFIENEQALLKEFLSREEPLVSSRLSYNRQVVALLNYRPAPALYKVTVPTLVLVGDQDSVTTPDMAAQIQTRIRHAQMEIIPGASHLMQIEKAHLVNKKILKFLRHP